MGKSMKKRFKDGDRVRVKHDKSHTGVVYAQTDDRVLWDCKKCGKVGDDLVKDLELIKK